MNLKQEVLSILDIGQSCVNSSPWQLGGITQPWTSIFGYILENIFKYKERLKGVHILLSNSQAGPGETAKQEQEEISRNHVQTF